MYYQHLSLAIICAVVFFVLSRDYNCDSTTIRLRYDYTTTHSTTTEVVECVVVLSYRSRIAIVI